MFAFIKITGTLITMKDNLSITQHHIIVDWFFKMKTFLIITVCISFIQVNPRKRTAPYTGLLSDSTPSLLALIILVYHGPPKFSTPISYSLMKAAFYPNKKK
jgi:hypothetical protein